MKTSLKIIMLATMLIMACSKKSDTIPNSVTINGKAYNTVVIGKQTLTSVNYDGPGGTVNARVDENVYGKLYQYSELSGISLPSGWRIPDQDDFVALLGSQGNINGNSAEVISLDTAATKYLRSKTDWSLNNGNNRSGFNAEPAGIFYKDPYSIVQFFSGTAAFWSTTTTSVSETTGNAVMIITALSPSPQITETAVMQGINSMSGVGLSLRFVKDN